MQPPRPIGRRRSRGENLPLALRRLKSHCSTCGAKHLLSPYFLPRSTMNHVLDRVRDSDDDRQWEDLPDERLRPHSRSSSSTRSSSFKNTASAARARRTTRQRPIFPSTSPRKHFSSDHRTPVRARRGRDFVAEPLPQDLLGSLPPGFGDGSLIQPL